MKCHLFNMQCHACTSQLTAKMNLTFVCIRKTFGIYLCLGVEKVFPHSSCSVFVFSACEFLFKAVIFISFSFSVVLIDNMAF